MSRPAENKWVWVIDRLLVANAVVFMLGLLAGLIDWQTGVALLLAMATLYAISKHEKRNASDGGD